MGIGEGRQSLRGDGSAQGGRIGGGGVTPKTRWSLIDLEEDKPADERRPGALARGEAGWRLSGAGVQYGLMECAGPATGSREVLLRFDAGVGTQDIGFRGEGTVLVKGGRLVKRGLVRSDPCGER